MPASNKERLQARARALEERSQIAPPVALSEGPAPVLLPAQGSRWEPVPLGAARQAGAAVLVWAVASRLASRDSRVSTVAIARLGALSERGVRGVMARLPEWQWERGVWVPTVSAQDVARGLCGAWGRVSAEHVLACRGRGGSGLTDLRVLVAVTFAQGLPEAASQAQIGALLGVDRRTVLRSLGRLRALGLVHAEACGKVGGCARYVTFGVTAGAARGG